MLFKPLTHLSLSSPQCPLDHLWNSAVLPSLQRWVHQSFSCILMSSLISVELNYISLWPALCSSLLEDMRGAAMPGESPGPPHSVPGSHWWVLGTGVRTCTKLQGVLWPACGASCTLLVSCSWQVSELSNLCPKPSLIVTFTGSSVKKLHNLIMFSVKVLLPRLFFFKYCAL